MAQPEDHGTAGDRIGARRTEHIDEGMAHAWLDGQLSSEEAAWVEAHIAGCAACAALVAEARGFVAASSRILTGLDGVPARVVARSRVRMWQVRAAAAVVVVALGAAAVLSGPGRMSEVERAIGAAQPPVPSAAPSVTPSVTSSVTSSPEPLAAAPGAAQAAPPAPPRMSRSLDQPAAPTENLMARKSAVAGAGRGRSADVAANNAGALQGAQSSAQGAAGAMPNAVPTVVPNAVPTVVPGAPPPVRQQYGQPTGQELSQQMRLQPRQLAKAQPSSPLLADSLARDRLRTDAPAPASAQAEPQVADAASRVTTGGRSATSGMFGAKAVDARSSHAYAACAGRVVRVVTSGAGEVRLDSARSTDGHVGGFAVTLADTSGAVGGTLAQPTVQGWWVPIGADSAVVTVRTGESYLGSPSGDSVRVTANATSSADANADAAEGSLGAGRTTTRVRCIAP